MEKTMYDLKKEQNKEIKKAYKERRKVINKEIRSVQFDKNNVMLSIIALLAGIGGITFGISSEKVFDNEFLGTIFLTLCGVSIGASPLILFDVENNNRQEKVKKLIELKNELEEVIKEQKISNKDKKILKKEYVEHI